MERDPDSPKSRLDDLRSRFHARAAGCWRVSPDRSALEQVAFSAHELMTAEVSEGFASATRLVPFHAAELGIVNAATSGQVTVSRLAEISPDSGSGLWLRRFEATRSVAVPLIDDSGLIGVVSIALSDPDPDDQEVARAIREAVTTWRVEWVSGLEALRPRQ